MSALSPSGERNTLLVTGGAGFIGNSFVAAAVAKGYHVVVLDALTYAGHMTNLEWIMSSPAGGYWEMVHGNITDGALLQDILIKYTPQAIINFAAETHVDNSIAAPSVFIETNVNGVLKLLEASRAFLKMLSPEEQKRFRFVQVSTDEVYGSLGPNGKFTETSPYQPNSPYSASKAAGDHLARAWYATYGIPTIITHSSNNYGPHQHPEKLIPNIIQCALQGKKLPLYGDGRNIRDWIHVRDNANGILLALEKGKAGERYNLGADQEMDNLTLVQNICKLLDTKQPLSTGSYQSRIEFVVDRAGHDRRYAIDSTKAHRELGFNCQHNISQGLEATVDWYLSHQLWCNVRMKQQ